MLFVYVRLHFETSSVLFRQLPVGAVEKPENWTYAPATVGECVCACVCACVCKFEVFYSCCTPLFPIL